MRGRALSRAPAMKPYGIAASAATNAGAFGVPQPVVAS